MAQRDGQVYVTILQLESGYQIPRTYRMGHTTTLLSFIELSTQEGTSTIYNVIGLPEDDLCSRRDFSCAVPLVPEMLKPYLSCNPKTAKTMGLRPHHLI